MTKKKTPKAIIVSDPNGEGEIKELSIQHELFCQLYVNNSEFLGNATFCYAAAYGIDLDKGSHKTKKKQYKTVQAAASRLLSNVIIRERITELLNSTLADKYVDAELAKLIQQNYKLDAKIQAIREYNKIKGRVKPQQPGNNFFQLNIGKLRDEYAA